MDSIKMKQVADPESAEQGMMKTKEADGADERMLPAGEKFLAGDGRASDVKFTNEEKEKLNGDAKIDIGDMKQKFVGMSKDELMKYANDPFWVRLRWALFVGFWLLWAAMLGGAVLIIVAAPKCVQPEPRSWWEQGPLTEIDYSVTDEELNNLKTEGFTGVIVDWPEEAYKATTESPRSAGFKDLLNRVSTSGLNAIIDLKPTTSSAWFSQSERREGDYTDYYIWKASGSFNASGAAEPPNNWLSKQNVSAWKYSNVRNEFYFSPDDAPRLNFRNPKVVGEFHAVLTRLAPQYSGVRLTGAPDLLVDDSLEDESIDTSKVGFTHTEYGFYTHARTEYVAELGPLLANIRYKVKALTDNGPFMLSEELRTLEPFKVNNSLVVDLPLQARALGKPVVSASSLNADLAESFGFLESKYWPLWKPSLANNLPRDVALTISLLLPGTALVDKNVQLPLDLLALRSFPSIMHGGIDRYEIANKTILVFVRLSAGNPGILVAVNPTNSSVAIDFVREIPAVADEVTVQFVTSRYEASEDVQVKSKVSASSIPLSARSAIVLSYVSKKE